MYILNFNTTSLLAFNCFHRKRVYLYNNAARILHFVIIVSTKYRSFKLKVSVLETIVKTL